jgi:hypothetical protein
MSAQVLGVGNGDNHMRIIQVFLRSIFLYPSNQPNFHVSTITHGITCVLSQEDIIETVNNHPSAGWTASRNPYFSNYTVSDNTSC